MLFQYLFYIAIFITTATAEQTKGGKHNKRKCKSHEDNGNLFTVKDQCDAYKECHYGEKIEKLCPDGLVYKPGTPKGRYPCWNPLEVDCGERKKLQTPQPTANCARASGYFAHYSDCRIFYHCDKGREFEVSCPRGMAFSTGHNLCTWPDQAVGCNAEEYLGFTCPSSVKVGVIKDSRHKPAFSNTFTKHAHSECDKYFVCLNGSPREQSCEYGQIFEVYRNRCIDQHPSGSSATKLVSKCQNFYSNEELIVLEKAREDRRKREEAKVIRLIDLARKHNSN